MVAIHGPGVKVKGMVKERVKRADHAAHLTYNEIGTDGRDWWIKKNGFIDLKSPAIDG
jgi:hypothetical protein